MKIPPVVKAPLSPKKPFSKKATAVSTAQFSFYSNFELIVVLI